MSFGAFRFGALRLVLLTLVTFLLLAGCTSDSTDGASISWVDVPPTPLPTPTSESVEDMAGVGGSTGELPETGDSFAAPGEASHDTSTLLTASELVQYQPNELGVVPILEYHVITTNPGEVAQFVRLADDMRSDLQWLYDNDFHVVPLSDVVSNSIQVPPGKHPVALTFDDGTSSHFSYLEDASGEIVLDDKGEPVIDPDCAVGILEAFYAKHPDFGHGAHFAPLIFNAFAHPDTEQHALFDQKVLWMVENGYEIGNHTHQHNNLTDISNEEFMMAIGEPQIYMDSLLGDHPGNASDILTLPYGSTPDADAHPDQREMLRNGFTYKDHAIFISGALLVGADPSPSPAGIQWDKLWIPRIQMFEESVEFWFGMFERDEMVLYTSDGNPDTVVVPNPQHPSLEGQLDEEAVTSAGKSLIHYSPEDGSTVAWAPKVVVASRRDVGAGIALAI